MNVVTHWDINVQCLLGKDSYPSENGELHVHCVCVVMANLVIHTVQTCTFSL